MEHVVRRVADRVVVVDQLDTAGRHRAHGLRQRPGTLLGTGLKKRGTQNVAVPEFSFSARRHQSSERSWWLSDGNPQGSFDVIQLRYSHVEPGFTFAIFPRRKVNRHHKRPAYIELLTRTLTRKPKLISNRRAKKAAERSTKSAGLGVAPMSTRNLVRWLRQAL